MRDNVPTREIGLQFPKVPVHYWLIGFGSTVLLLIGGALLLLKLHSTRPLQSTSVTTIQPIRAVSALGRLEPNGEVIRISAPMYSEGSRIAELRVEETDHVKAGQIIAVLDRRDRLHSALAQAQKQVAVAQAKLEQVKAGAKSGEINAQQGTITQLQAQLRNDVAAKQATVERQAAEVHNARLEYQRYQSLDQNGAVSASLRDSKRLTFETALQQLSEAKANLDQTSSSLTQQINAAKATLDRIAEVRPTDVQEAEAEVASAIAALQKARSDLETAYVRAPQDGQILKIHARAGEVVGNDGIAEIGRTSQMDAVAEVYETDLAKVRVGQSVKITSLNQAFLGKLHGTVYRILPQIAKKDVLNTDPAASVDARVAEVRIQLASGDLQKVKDLTNLKIQAVIHTDSL